MKNEGTERIIDNVLNRMDLNAELTKKGLPTVGQMAEENYKSSVSAVPMGIEESEELQRKVETEIRLDEQAARVGEMRDKEPYLKGSINTPEYISPSGSSLDDEEFQMVSERTSSMKTKAKHN